MTTPSHVRTKQYFDEYMAFLDIFTEEECIKGAVDSLISYLYRPISDARYGNTWCVDGRKLRRFRLADEPINWGDLSCAEVEKLGEDGWLVTIEEASPECPNLCQWVQGWLGWWGWPTVRVQTEW